ncbi:isopentenyl-diphosphate delta-isomerase [Arthrobacter crystallopoietes BAB-32]|uniref:Isopentenyl-diphosphate Delta-isomerase n=1 Tax=Arthrobacter crystallopoietes BAB-32 TaxID=1246476 RepID=N1UUC7_9MICC|nr:isopentenyl-diphosphate delta-isomerase [Arthrobacter crystallopoietes BAB-32]
MELVVLANNDGGRIGTADKATVHHAETPLHLAFSCHLFNSQGEYLATRRALSKKTWPGVWTNSFCGHPGPDEETADAVLRRAPQELGTEVADLQLVLPDFRYRATDASGIVEHEICPVYVARLQTDPDPEPSEVAEWKWVPPSLLLQAVTATPWAFSPWLALQLPLLAEASPDLFAD